MTTKTLMIPSLPNVFAGYVESLQEMFGSENVTEATGDFESYLVINIDLNTRHDITEEELKWYRIGFIRGALKERDWNFDRKIEQEENHYADFIG